jgi:hypothetical protein
MDPLQQAQAWATIVAAVAAMLTFAALIWYTIETQRLRRAAERQNEIAGMPIIALRLSSGERKLGQPLSLASQSIRNVGNGTAFNIEISTVQNRPFEIRFESTPLLEPKDNQLLDYTIWQDAVTTGFSKRTVWLESIIESGQLGSDMPVDITYSDAAGKRYRSSHSVKYDAAKAVWTVFGGHSEVP